MFPLAKCGDRDMKKIVFIGLLLASSILAGCASSGNKSIENESQISVQSKIIKGQTTKEKIRSMYGDPSTASFTSDGKEQWHYILANMKISGKTFIPFYGLFDGGATTDMKQLVIVFKDNVVENYTFINSKTETKSGILN